MTERLQKIISASGLCSRRAAERMIDSGRVTVNGRRAFTGMSADPIRDVIEADGRPLPKNEGDRYVMLNKPKGFITSMSDEKGRRVVTELVRGLGVRIYPVGRLDYNTEGLLILTNDGETANRLMHPRHRVPRQYLVRVSGGDLQAMMEISRVGLYIEGRKTEPCGVEVVKAMDNGHILLITLFEGRNREVRRLCEAAGMNPLRLKRVAIGELRLGKLKLGQYRELTPAEIEYIKGL